MNYKHVILGFFIFIIGQILVWLQVNGPLLWPWAREWRWGLLLLGIPITWLFQEATALLVTGFDGNFWPSRFISFTAGIIIFSIMTYLFKAESITIKTALSLTLAFGIIIIQLFWK
jgi:hypothetical protein